MVQHVQGSMAAARWARARAEGGGRGERKRLADSEPHRRAARRSVGPAGAAEGGGCIFCKKSSQVKSSQVKSLSLHSSHKSQRSPLLGAVRDIKDGCASSEGRESSNDTARWPLF